MSGKVKILKVRCPRCGLRVNWNGNEHRPFCSDRCRLIDLGRWADEDYRIAGSPVPAEDSTDEEF